MPRAAVAALLALTYLSTATAALPLVCSMGCVRAEGASGASCHRSTEAKAGKSCHRAKPEARCPMHASGSGAGRCCAMSGDPQQATDQLILSLLGSVFVVPQAASLFPAPGGTPLVSSTFESPLDHLSVPRTPPPRV